MAGTKIPVPPREELYRLYVDEGLSVRGIASRYYVASSVAHRWLVAVGIERRDIKLPMPDRETLRSLYEDKNLTQMEIGEKYGVSHMVVSRWMKEHNIPARSRSDPRRRKRKGSPKVRVAPSMRKPRKDPGEARLKEMYVERRMSQRQIADALDVSYQSVRNWMAKYEIQARPKPPRQDLVSLSSKVPSPLAERVRAECGRRGCSVNSFVTSAIEAALESEVD